MQGITRLLQKLLHAASRMSTAIAVLAVLSVVSVLGTLVPQGLGYNAYAAEYGPLWADIITGLQLHTVFQAWWFLLALVFLVVSVSACLYVNGPVILQQLRAPRSVPAAATLEKWPIKVGRTFASVADMEAHVSRAGAKILHREEGAVYAVTGRAGRVGYFLLHGGVVLLCVGGLISGFFGFRGVVNLPEGAATAEVYAFNARGEQTVTYPLPFGIINRGFRIETFTNGLPKSYETDVTLFSGGNPQNVLKQGTVAVNSPVRSGFYGIYQNDYVDAGSQVQVRLRDVRTADGRVNAQGAGTALRLDVGQALQNERSGHTIVIEALHETTPEADAAAGRHIPTFTNRGPAVDYVVRSLDADAIGLRSYLEYPDIIGLNDGEGAFTPLFLGLSVTNPKGWELLELYLSALRERYGDMTPSEEQRLSLFAEVAAEPLKRFAAEERVQLGMRVMQAADVLLAVNTPFLLHLEDYDKKYASGLMVNYDPGAPLFLLASLLLIMGMAGMVYTRYGRIWAVLRPIENGEVQVIFFARGQRGHDWLRSRLEGKKDAF